MKRHNAHVAGVFTLIELLIVVAIIAILAGMLLPALNKARETAKSIKCIGQLGQIGTAFRLYIDDNKDYFPIFNGAPGGYYWSRYLFWYEDMSKLYNGETDPQPLPAATRNANLKYMHYRMLICPSKPTNKQVSYGYNYRVLGEKKAGQICNRKLSKCKEPSRQYVAMDSQLGDTDDGVSDLVFLSSAATQNRPSPRHNKTVNIVYADGHAAGIKTIGTTSTPNDTYLPGGLGTGRSSGGSDDPEFYGVYSAESGWCRFR